MEVNKVMTNFCGSSFWNSSLTWYTKHPDLTICFERTVLLSVPCIYLWIFSCMEIYRISKSQNKFIPWNWRNVAKLLVIMVLCLLTLSEITFTVLFTQHTYGVDIYAALIKLISFALTFVLLIYNRKYGIRSSGMQFIFWLLLALCGIFQLRTEIGNVRMKYLHYYHSYLFYSIYYSLVWLMLLLSSLNDRPPRCDVKKSKKLSPEEESGFISRLMFSWFETLAWKGFRNPLTGSDVYDLKSEDTAKEVVLIFDTELHKSPSKSNSSKKTGGHTSVLPVILRSFMSSFIFGVILKFSSDLLCFATPQILSLLINFVNEKQEYWKGYFYAVLLFTSETIRSLTFSQYSYKMNVLGLRVKTSLNSAIYRKALKISNKVRRNYTAGEIVNLISSDVKNVLELPTNIIVVMSAVLQVLIALYFLWNILGISVVAGLTVIVILVPINAVISNTLKKLQTLRMQCTDGRIKIVNEVLNSIKVLKLYAWEPCFKTKISKIRNEEIGYLKKIVYLNSGTSFIWACAPFMVSLVCFATFVLIDKENILNAKVAFVSISLFNLLKYPLNLLPIMISNIVQASVSIKRINKLLNAEELNPDNVSHNPKEAAPLLIRNGYFSWGEQKILKNINIDIEKKSLTAILGSVGSGKSSLLSAFLGETHKISGYVNTVGTMAYVPQQAWIINATLRDNILFGKSYDRIKYQRVIRACALKSDFEMLPGGDSTEIGEKGINLSGGQKQRISLARAVYSGADIYFLDDPLSAVDTQVGKHIFEKVIGPHGLLSTRTRVFVTHGITYLSQTDKVVVLKNGEISESGTYQELLDKRGDFSEFLMNHINEDSDEFNKEMMYKRKSEISNDSFQHSSISLEKLLLSSQTISQTNLLSHKIVEVEKMETGSVGYEIYKYYLKSIGCFLLMATVVSNLSCHMLTIGCSFWLSLWSTDQDITGNGPADHSKTTFYLIIYSIFGLGKGITTIFAVLAPQLGGCYAAIKLHLMLLKRIIHAPMSFFDVTPIGRILCRFSKDVGVVDNKLAYYLFDGTNSIFMVLGTLVVISYTAPIFIVVIIPIGLIYYLIQKFYVETSRQLKRLEAISRSPIYSFFGESIAGASSIRAFRDESRFTTNFEDRVDVNQACYYLSVVSNRWLAIRLEALGNIVVFFAVIFAVTDKHLNAGLLGLSVTYALEITQTLNYLVRITSEVETNIVSVERLKEYEEAPQEAPWEVVEKTPDSSWPNNGVVVFKNYGVRYRPGLDLVLQDANFKINENEKIGIVGRTGAGKSSLTLSLFRILEAARGGIFIDDVNIADLGLHALRSRITIIPQDAVLFSGTVRMNLDPYDKHNDEEIWRTLEHAHLKSFVSGLPDGLNHIAAEGGENFSLGQRQLICLGRALLRKTKVLVLDEATAAVDLETDNLIQRTIRKEFSECTVLTIAHRLNTIMDSDKVIVLDKGTVIEFDSPANLLKTDSIFYRMCKDAGLVQSNL